jgi:hypothetical protein
MQVRNLSAAGNWSLRFEEIHCIRRGKRSVRGGGKWRTGRCGNKYAFVPPLGVRHKGANGLIDRDWLRV